VLRESICKSIYIKGKDGERLANDKLYGYLPRHPSVDMMYDLTYEADKAQVVPV